jgi:two-component system, NtrC family, sensor histidine kinase PilS
VAQWFESSAEGLLPSAGGVEPQPGLRGLASIGLNDNAQARVHRTYAAARASIGLGVVAAQVLLAITGSPPPLLQVLVCMAYAVQALTLWLLPRFEVLASPSRRGLARRRWMVTIGVDLLCFGLLYLMSATATFSYAALLVLPVLMAGVTLPRLLALGTAAGVTLLLLSVATRQEFGSTESANVLLQAGLSGLGLFVIALLAGELSSRLAREQEAARGSLELARQQVLINRLVIEEMADGVIVVDRSGTVRALNPAARALLVAVGLAPPPPLSLHDQAAWSPLVLASAEALDRGTWPEEGRELLLSFGDGSTRTLRMRVRFIRSPASAARAEEPLVMLLLEDMRNVQQRTRQEKLAAMGRVSAGVAHEIRNPLAAIAQAQALLQESLPTTQAGLVPAPGVDDATVQRLMAIMADNIQRLKRIVDDVMEAAPAGEFTPGVIDATEVLAAATTDWARTAGVALGADSRLRVELPDAALGVRFDEDHLRRVLVNLLDNAGRHAAPGAGSIGLRLAAHGSSLAQLVVASHGEPIAPDVERYLFEPFFSTRSRGTGLGLYICRELCQRNGAAIDYRARPHDPWGRNQFVVTLQRAPLATTSGHLPWVG